MDKIRAKKKDRFVDASLSIFSRRNNHNSKTFGFCLKKKMVTAAALNHKATDNIFIYCKKEKKKNKKVNRQSEYALGRTFKFQSIWFVIFMLIFFLELLLRKEKSSAFFAMLNKYGRPTFWLVVRQVHRFAS